MKRDNGDAEKETNLLSLRLLLLNIGQSDQSEKYLHRYLDQLSEDHPDVPRSYSALEVLATRTDQLDPSLIWCQKSLEMKLQTLRSNDPQLAYTYMGIGIVHRKKGRSDPAIESFQRALKI